MYMVKIQIVLFFCYVLCHIPLNEKLENIFFVKPFGKCLLGLFTVGRAVSFLVL
jgi:hypothetical protein